MREPKHVSNNVIYKSPSGHILMMIGSGEDYNGTMTEVVFPESSMQGETVCGDIVIIDDDALECSQDFTVAIGSTTLGTATGTQSQAVVTIEDNDSKFLTSFQQCFPTFRRDRVSYIIL